MVTKATFVTLANKLATTTFLNFFDSRTFAEPDTTNPITGVVVVGASEIIPAVRIEYLQTQYNGAQIKVGDFQLMARVAEFSAVSPKTSGVTVMVEGVKCQVVSAEKDAAEAMWTMQVRAL